MAPFLIERQNFLKNPLDSNNKLTKTAFYVIKRSDDKLFVDENDKLKCRCTENRNH